MHDTVNLEADGVPGLFIASRAFAHAAVCQAQALGADPVGVFVEHPIQDRTDSEMSHLATGSMDEILAALVEG